MGPDGLFLRRLLALGAWGAAMALRAQPAGPPSGDQPIQLGALRVTDSTLDGFVDPTGMDAPEAERSEPPFSNDLIMAETVDENALDDIGNELAAVNPAPPADSAAGVNRVNLKGFPTPRQRNGFSQVGVPEILNTIGSESIQGPLTPVVGRAAPGGIQNFLINRPRGKKLTRFDLGVTSHAQQTATAETTGVLVEKRSWHRFAAAWDQRSGPEPFSYNRHRSVDGAVVWKFSRAWSAMVQLDYDERAANTAPGVPEYRASAVGKILEPYRPLASFNVYGPNAGFRKRTASGSLQLEGQLGRRVSVRASLQGLTRAFDEDRWTTGQFLLDPKKFGGTREPQHTEQPFTAVTGQLDVTTRFAFAHAEHKLTVSLESTRTNYERVQRALEKADRDALPLDVRVFDPAAPNYFRPDYSRDRYSRFITNREEVNDYTGIFVSERTALLQGRLVLTAGARKDFVTIDVTDRRPGAVRPHVLDHVDEFSHHLGANFILVKSRVLLFANTSTAFEPSSRVDARTGRVQGNETTLGYEAGGKALFLDRRLAVIGMGFTYFNQNISRRNPLYDDPIADANQTQPQLVAAGEERFTGGALEAKFKVSNAWTVSGKATYNHAITTKSPDLPEEIGRPLTRFPHLTWGLNARYAWLRDGKPSGFAIGAGATFVSGTTANYENTTHAHLAYPGYVLCNVNATYRWKLGRFEHTLGASVRNALDRDLLAQLARPAAGREFAASYGLGW